MQLNGKKVTVFGMGKSGLAALRLLERENAQVTAISAGEPKNWKEFETIKKLAQNCLAQEAPEAADAIIESELIILSPGISQQHPLLQSAKSRKVPIWSEIALGQQFLQRPVAALTGTNGKTTTTYLVGEILKGNDKSVALCGNYGYPLCDFIVEGQNAEYVVLELSSFQCEALIDSSFDVVALLNITMSHGERYKNLEDYTNAKLELLKHIKSGGKAFIHSSLNLNLNIAHETINDDVVEEFFQKKTFSLPGKHNKTNFYFAFKLAQELCSEKLELEGVLSGLKPLEHRIEKVINKKNFEIYNDSKSTNYESLKIALNSFEGKKVSLILGGKKRGTGDDISSMISFLKKKVSYIFLIGETTDTLATQLDGQLEFERSYELKNIELKDNFEGVLLFSPAFPSFDQFINYEERGRVFKEIFSK